jgi:hypothetical protein
MTLGTSSITPFYDILGAVMDSYKQFTPRSMRLFYNDELHNAFGE